MAAASAPLPPQPPPGRAFSKTAKNRGKISARTFFWGERGLFSYNYFAYIRIYHIVINMQTRGKLRYSPSHKRLIKRLISAREHANLTQAQVAKLLGKRQPNISKMEAGQRSIDVVELIEFGKIYKQLINYFFE